MYKGGAVSAENIIYNTSRQTDWAQKRALKINKFSGSFVALQ